MKLLKKIAITIIILVLIVFAFAIWAVESSDKPKTDTVESATKVETSKDYSDIVVPFTKADTPKIYNAWGEKWINDINAMMPQAVNSVANNPKCDEPVDIGLSMERSKPKENAVFFVDCKNQQRFYVEKSQLNDGANITSESEQLQDAVKYIPECEKAVKATLNHPETFDKKTLSTQARKADVTGNVVITMPFTAKNSLGAELEQVATCTVNTQGELILDIS